MTKFVSSFLVALALGACAFPNQSGDSPGAEPRSATETRAPEDPDRTNKSR